ncbi:MAG: FdtA/QdtA family cupin domain-containing protein [Bacteroidales bacterium]|nr:FdtA/QdtA family cupin domain-containing protein [Bacteroidales bacterium]
MDISDCRLINLPVIPDDRGNLSFVEECNHIPFRINRTYWLYDVPGGERRAGYALRDTDDFVIAMSGSFDVFLSDGKDEKTVRLNRSYCGLYIPRGIWHEFRDFSTNSLALVLSSRHYDALQYVRPLEEFVELKQNGKI